MGGYVAYPEYKDSGVEWVGEIPTHWDSLSLRRTLIEPLVNGLFKKKECWGTGVRIVNVFDAYVEGDVIDEPSLDRVVCNNEEIEKYLVKHGDFVFVRSSLKLEGIGKIASILKPTEAIVFECHLVRGRPDPINVDPKFLCYFLNSSYSRQFLVSFSNQVTMATLDQEKLKKLRIVIPEISEQHTIARFLDYKTAQIDALIAKKETLLKKLAEKRTALISHAVTKGLDPSAPMKDSGVPWLGDIPAHWHVKRLRFCIITNPSKNEIRLPSDAMVSFVPMDAIGEYGGIRLAEEKELSEIGSGYTYFSDNDVVVAKITPCFENGKGAIGKHLTNAAAFGTTELHVLRTLPCMLPEYLFHWTMSYIFRNVGESEMYGAGGQKRIPESFIKDFRIGQPPLYEQTNIVEYINTESTFLDEQSNKIQTAINKLKEYRTALITQAVTGKIDLRKVPVPAQTEAEAA